MRRRPLAGVAAALVLTAVGACSLAVNLDSLSDGVCPAGSKPCNAECVSEMRAEFGCAAIGCAPCTLPNADTICSQASVCAIALCIGTYQNCDGLAANGCETDTDHDPNHCGSCTATPCTTQNGTPGCSAGHCTTLKCNPGWGDCNDNPEDGCETDVETDPMNCGECQNPCDAGTCQSGKCL